ncbi:hypothetical protein [Mucilaginibacter terrae]|uniref:Uncharacterized protein n=1 Tax=Mucilaginibacter terrae TaxID=1955052 RepID=A0ABU3GUT1_9SPHI|nr:hypothetical protein [Mucilaginibacter terrae]MDT3403528.1 hypothetical protein [Mucilaginibacter terrae]
MSLSIKTPLLFAFIILLTAFGAKAQDKIKNIGNKARTGSSNASFAVVKGNQVGIKMKAGGKPVQLLKLNFGVENRNKDSIRFKVNVYEYDGTKTSNNYVKQDILGVIPPGKNRVDVNLAPYNVTVKGSLLVAIEWLETHKGSEPSFSIGLFNGGTFRYQTGEWNKIPVAGIDFNMDVKKLK